MVAENLFEKINFTEEMIEEYKKYNEIYLDRCDNLAKKYMNDEITIEDALKTAETFESQISPYTAHLMFLIECTGYLSQNYKKHGIPQEIFYETMIDITCKIQECKKVKGEFGTFVARWFNGTFKMTRFCLGRLCYDIWEHKDDKIIIGDYEINKGDFVINCHILSSGPLLYEDCLESFKMAYEFFKEKLKDGILVIECSTWLLFSDYINIFKSCSKNIYSFSKNFHIYKTKFTEKFQDDWRVFSVSLDNCTVDNLPTETRLQKAFVDYIKNEGKFGEGAGIALFDGEKILTREQ